MKRLPILATLLFAILPACDSKTTTSKRESDLAIAFRIRWEQIERDIKEIKQMTDEIEKRPAATDAERIARLQDIARRWQLVSQECDDAKLALDRWERAEGMRPDGQSMINTLDSTKAGAKTVIDQVRALDR